MTVFTDPALQLNDRGLPGFGMELQLDLGECDPAILVSPDDLVIFVGLLIEKIGMTAYGDPTVDKFGEGDLEGITVIQRIMTSNIKASTELRDRRAKPPITDIDMHAEPPVAGVHLNVFSCRAFDPAVVTQFAVEFFDSKLPPTVHVTNRSTPTRKH